MFRIEDAYFARVDLSLTAQRLYERLLSEIADARNPDYCGVAALRFDRLVLLLVRFCQTRIDALGSKFPYLRRLKCGEDAPLEHTLQDDLASYLFAQNDTEVERSGVSSGRVDLYLPQPVRPAFRFVIEVKRLLSAWSDEATAVSFGKRRLTRRLIFGSVSWQCWISLTGQRVFPTLTPASTWLSGRLWNTIGDTRWWCAFLVTPERRQTTRFPY